MSTLVEHHSCAPASRVFHARKSFVGGTLHLRARTVGLSKPSALVRRNLSSFRTLDFVGAMTGAMWVLCGCYDTHNTPATAVGGWF